MQPQSKPNLEFINREKKQSVCVCGVDFPGGAAQVFS